VAEELGHSVLGFAPSGLPGPAGNRETFAWIRAGGDPRAVDVEEAARRAEP
jgi:23S rRNA (cytidine1920-2'-O)/16S rRNA (cytidine1409-2'-O)-methyltransferase